MNYDDIKIRDDMYIYKNDNFVENAFIYYFLIDNKKETLYKLYLLNDYIERYSTKYKDREEIYKKRKSLYSCYPSIWHGLYGSKHIMYMYISYTSPKYVKEDYIDELLAFSKEILLNPCFDNNNLLDEIKKEHISSFENMSINNKQYRMFLNRVGRYGDYKELYETDVNKLKKDINKITLKDLEKFYYDFQKNYLFSYASGSLTDNEINKFNEVFKFNKIDFDYNFNGITKIPTGVEEYVDKNTSQSYLYVLYKMKDYSYDEVMLLNVIKNIVSGNQATITYEVLRKKYGLVYYCSAFASKVAGELVITADIDKKNYKKALSAIDEIIDKLQDKRTVNRILKNYKKQVKENYYLLSEDIQSLFNIGEKYVIKFDYRIDDFVAYLDTVTVDDIMEASKRFKKEYVFYYKGDKDE